ncbi:MAG: hypothetical protein Q9169_002674 [Polycauliona sp. 2 TL-2023]
MTISALPSQTIRAIGSTQVLTDPASLVKELVENALDAQSTSITVELSTNILDIIQVKDNGHGIAPIDRPLVCKRHCTSKIQDLDDLAKIGGASVGFRGEALASAVELSGGLTVTTRIPGEATAVSLKVGQNGEVTNDERVSHAVGTTVRITDFLQSIPVRRQTALKESAKQLAKIKRTLQAYTLARPSVRLSLKVLKAKNEKGNWTYAPKSDASVSDAALKVVGKKVTDECRWVVWTPNALREETGAIQEDGPTASATTTSTYQVEALMPKPDADDRKVTDPFLCMNLVCPPGSYDANVEPAKDDVLFSDSPRVLEVVEAFFKSQYGELQSKTKPAVGGKPTSMGERNFDLLLARKPPQALVHLAASGSVHHDSVVSSTAAAGGNSVSRTTGPERVLARSRRPADDIIVDQIGGVRHWVAEEAPEEGQSSPTKLANGAARSRHLNDNEDETTDANGVPSDHDPEDEEELRDVNVSNPWTFAKVNAPIRPQRPMVSGDNGISRNQQLFTPAKQHGNLGDDLFCPELPSNSTSHPEFPSPARSENGVSREVSSPETFPYPIKRWGKAQRDAGSRQELSPDEEDSSPTRLDTWIQRPQPHSEIASQRISTRDDDLQPSRPPNRDFLPASELPQGTPLSAIPDISLAPRRKAIPRKQQQAFSITITKPFKPPAVQDPSRVWFGNPDNPSPRPPKVNKQRTDNSLSARSLQRSLPDDINENDPISDTETTSPAQQQHPGLALTMDYETRKAAAVAQRRALLRRQSSNSNSTQQTHLIPPSSQGTQIKISSSQQSSSSMPSSSPHKNRYDAAIAALRSPRASINQDSNGGANAALPLLADDATTSPHANDQANIDTESEGMEKMHPNDPRALLMKFNSGHLKKIKLSNIPLETPSSNLETAANGIRNLTQILPTRTFLSSLPSISEGGNGEEYLDEFAEAFNDASVEEVRMWETRVVELLRKIYPRLSNNDGMEIDLVSIFTDLEQR